MRSIIHALRLIAVLLPSFCIAQERYDSASVSFDAFCQQVRTDSVLTFRNEKGFVPSVFHNLAEQAVAPFKMNKKQALLIVGAAGITAGLLHYDQEIEDYIRPVKERERWIKSISPEITELGDYYGYILLAGYGSYTIAAHRYKGFQTSLLASQAAITAGLWIRLGKMLCGRMRPGATYNDREFNSDHWFGPFGQFKPENNPRGVAAFDAFPSGHTGAAFAMATVFAMQYSETRAVPIISYSLASIVGVTRLIEHEHWASDVFAGGVIGYLCGRQVVLRDRRLFPRVAGKLSSRKVKTKSVFFPFTSKGVTGVQYHLTF